MYVSGCICRRTLMMLTPSLPVAWIQVMHNVVSSAPCGGGRKQCRILGPSQTMYATALLGGSWVLRYFDSLLSLVTVLPRLCKLLRNSWLLGCGDPTLLRRSNGVKGKMKWVARYLVFCMDRTVSCRGQTGLVCGKWTASVSLDGHGAWRYYEHFGHHPGTHVSLDALERSLYGVCERIPHGQVAKRLLTLLGVAGNRVSTM